MTGFRIVRHFAFVEVLLRSYRVMVVEKPNKSVMRMNKVCSIRVLCFHKASAARYIVINGRLS